MVEVKEILAQLRYNTGQFPRAALEAAIGRKDEIILSLLNVLQRSTDNLQATKEDERRMDYTFAMFLLAQFREKRAYPLLCRFFSGLEGDEYWFCGDIVTEDLPRLWASVFDGNLDPLVTIIENPRIDQFIRIAAVQAMGILYLCGDLDREYITGAFHKLIDNSEVKESPEVIGDLVYLAGELHLTELHPQIKKTYQEKLVDRSEHPLSQINLFFSLSEEQVLGRLRENRHHTKVNDTISEMEWWAAFRDP